MEALNKKPLQKSLTLQRHFYLLKPF